MSMLIAGDDGISSSFATIAIELMDQEEVTNYLTIGEGTYELASGHIRSRHNREHAGGDFIMVDDTVATALTDQVFLVARLMCFGCEDFAPRNLRL